MSLELKNLESVEAKLNNQNAFKAAAMVSLWIIPTLILWFWIDWLNPELSAVMLVLSGVVLGFAVRIHGKGYRRLFSLIAFIAHLLIVIAAFALNIVMGHQIWAFLLFALYFLGAFAAVSISKISVPFIEQRAFAQLAEYELHVSDEKLKNRWFVALPTVALATFLSTSITTIGLATIDVFQQELAVVVKAEQEQQQFADKNIDVSPTGLNHVTTKEALLYTYAYYKGFEMNRWGKYQGDFPQSTYKAETILKYLIKYRQNARAKMLLGLLDENKDHGFLLIQEAADEGDQYAKLYSAIDFGCYNNSDLGKRLLSGLKNLTKEKSVKKEIGHIINLDFVDICRIYKDIEFKFDHVAHYNEE